MSAPTDEHSLKDLPTTDPAGLVLLALPGREEVADALCGSTLAGLRSGARVGTCSPRRAAQLLAVRPDLTVVPVRGNVPTRLRHLSAAGWDAVVLAVAGLRRLGRADVISEILPVEQFPPSPGQGALGLQVRTDDLPVRGVFSSIGDPAVDAQVRAERAMLARLHGGCTVPVGAVAHSLPDGRLRLLGQVSSPDGVRQISATLDGQTDQPEQLGHALAAELIGHGAYAILNAAPVG